MTYISLYTEAEQLQMEYIKQDIQYATSDYPINTPTPSTNILGTADDRIKYIKEFLHPPASPILYWTSDHPNQSVLF